MTVDLENYTLWQQALALGEDGTGFYEKLPNAALVHYAPPNATRLMVAFDDLSRVSNGTPKRDPWGFKFALSQGWAFLGVMPHDVYWFRDEQLMNRMEALAASGFFARFEKTLFTGTSMGAFGACAFAKLAPGANVLAFSPQSTLDPRLQRFDRRYPKGLRAKWGGRYNTAGEGLTEANRAYLLYDPLLKVDRLHISRIKGPNVVAMPAMGCGHHVALVCRNVGILKPISSLAMEGELDRENFRALIKKRRAAQIVRNTSVKFLRSNGHEEWATSYARALFKFQKKQRRAADLGKGLELLS